MVAFCAIAVLFTLSWLGAIWLYKRASQPLKSFENTWGPSFFVFFIIMFALQILLVRTMSGVMNAPSAQSSSPSDPAPVLIAGLTVGQVIFIAILTMLTFWAFSKQLQFTIRYLLRNSPGWGFLLSWLAIIALGVLMAIKMIHNSVWAGNILIFLILMLSLSFSVALKKSSFILIFGAIMLLDIWLVWNTGLNKPAVAAAGSATQGVGDGWYVRMFQSKLVQHFPFPIGFRWGGHLLGGGDVFFTTMMVMYACRVWSKRAAITVGILATLPLLLLPFVPLILKTPPVAWPYTIFIAPWALIIAVFAPKRIEAPVLHIPDAWKEGDDGPEVIGRYPK